MGGEVGDIFVIMEADVLLQGDFKADDRAMKIAVIIFKTAGFEMDIGRGGIDDAVKIVAVLYVDVVAFF